MSEEEHSPKKSDPGGVIEPDREDKLAGPAPAPGCVDVEVTAGAGCHEPSVPASESTSDTRVMKGASSRGLPEFGNNYETVGILGSGGMSIVYKVRHKLIGTIFAAKVLHSHLMKNEAQRSRFNSEAMALFKLKHPNIISVRAFDQAPDTTPYLLMDYLDGVGLNDELKRLGALPVPRALRIFVQSCDALQEAHNNEIIHRDIKPSNIILTADNEGAEQVKLVDFGIAKLKQEEGRPATTATGEVFGSPPYMSPEQCLGQSLDARSDIYSLGCVMYEVLSGNPPFTGSSALAVIHMHSSKTPEPISIPNCDAKLRNRLDEIIFKALEKDPNKRYQAMSELKKDLIEISESTGWKKKTGVYLKYTRSQRKVANSVRRHPIILSLVCAVVLATVISCAAAAIGFYNDEIVPLSQPPAPTFASVPDWNWHLVKVEASPLDMERRINLAHVIIDRYQYKEGDHGPDVLRENAELAYFLKQHGQYSQAITPLLEWYRYLAHNSTQFAQDDVRIADAAAALGDCLSMQGSLIDNKNALQWYDKAAKIYESNKGFEIETPVAMRTRAGVSALRCAVALYKARPNDPEVPGAITYAARSFKIALGEMERNSSYAVICHAGLGDCALVQALMENPSGKTLVAASTLAWNEYQRSQSVPAVGLSHEELNLEKALCHLRMADCYILEHKYEDALNEYNAEGCLLSFDSNTNVQQTYSRLLWSTGHFQSAIKNELRRKL